MHRLIQRGKRLFVDADLVFDVALKLWIACKFEFD
jgi:hypothetical protein